MDPRLTDQCTRALPVPALRPLSGLFLKMEVRYGPLTVIEGVQEGCSSICNQVVQARRK